VITVVLIDDAISGLQVQKPNDSSDVWYDVPIVPKALLVDVRDVIEVGTYIYRLLSFLDLTTEPGGHSVVKMVADHEQWVVEEPRA
jgi:hypothetical protein